MNKIHSKVWNKELGQLVVASEFARSDSAGVVQGAASARRTLLAVALAPLLALAGTTAVAQEWTVSDGASVAVIGQGGQVTVEGDQNISVVLSGTDDDATLAITLERDIDVDTITVGESITVGDTVINTGGVAIGAATLNATGLHVGGVSVTGTGINAGGNTIAGVAAGTAADHAVNFGQLDAVQGTVADHAAAILANADEIEAVRATASAGWDISAEGGTAANVGSGGSVDFSGDGNIEVARTGTDLTFSLADDISVDSIEVGGMTLDSGGIDVAGQRITGLADGAISETSTDAVTGRQLHNALFEGGTAFGVRYFRANSFAPDSVAEGQEAVAIGPGTVAGGDSSFAAGDGAATTETAEGAIALGQGAVAGTEGGDVDDGVGSIAIGRDSQASGNSTVALGDGANVASEHVADATALGAGASVTGNFATGGTAVGANAHASAGNATALGTNAHASGGASIAVGQAHAAAGNAIAAGTGAYVGSYNSIALGTGAGVGTEGVDAGDRTDHIAIGTAAGQNVVGNQSTAIGYGAGQGVVGDGNVALGVEAGRGLAGNNNISIGVNANDGAGARAQAIAIGDGTAAGSDSVALGSGASAAGTETVALGKDSRAGANGVALGAHAEAQGSNVAIGRNSIAYESDVTGSGYLTGDAAPGSAVSVGSSNPGEAFQRRITNLADGAQRYDAVNVGQLQEAQRSVATLVGGGVTLNADGTYSPIIVDVVGGGTAEFATVVEAIGAVTSGDVDILPVDAVRYNAVGGISNVAAGTSATDAVNVEQLNEAIAESGVKYFSASTTVDANRANDGATADNAMAIGPAAVASGASSLAVGHAARVNAGAHNAVAIGHDVSARAENATVLGNRSHTYNAGGVAIGQQAVSRGQNSIVMGTGAEADPKSGQTVDNAIVIGTVAEATADDGIAVGQSALASEDRAVAQGYDAHAMAVDSQAFGTRARTTGVSSQASGTDAHASGVNAIASGTNARGYANDGIAMGTGAISGFVVDIPGDAPRNHGSIAIGDTSRADDLNAMALGVEAQARAGSATAIGDSAVATEDAEDGLAVGSSARVTAQNASAFGRGAEAVAEDALAVGSGARAAGQSASAVGQGAEASAANASAFGQGARALHQGSVALGSGAETAAAVGTASYTVDKNTYDFAGTTPVATVSVGAPGQERTITNVAAGRISDESTDAINGSQLYSTNQAVDALAGDLDTAGQSVAAALGGTSSYNPETHTVTAGLSVQGNNYTNVQDALTYVGQGWNVSAEGGATANVAPGGSVDFSSDDGNIVVSRDGTNLVFDLAENIDLGEGGSLTTGNTVVNNAGVTVEDEDGNVTTVSLDGVAVADDAGNSTQVGAGDISVTDGMGTTAIGGSEISVGGDNPILISGDTGTIGGLTNTTFDPDATYEGGLAATQEQLSQVHGDLTTAGLNFVGDDGTNVHRDLGEQLSITGGATGALSEGNIGVTANAAGDGLVVELADNIELTEDGSLTIGDAELDNDGLTVVDADGNVTTVAADGATVDDGAGNSTTVAATGTTVTDGSATTSVEAGVVTVTANPTTGPANTIVIDANTGTIGGLANQTIDYQGFADGSGRAATEEQLSIVNETANAGWNLTDAEGNEVNIGPNGLVTFEGDDNITVAQTGEDQDGVIEVTLNRNLDVDSVTAGNSVLDNDGLVIDDGAGNHTAVGAGTVTVTANPTTGPANTIVIDANTGTIGGLANQDIDYPGFADGSGRAATEEQLAQVNDTANMGWNISAQGENGTNVGPGGSVDLSNTDGNIVIAKEDDSNDVTFDLADDLVIGNSITAGDTYIDTTGVAIGADVHLGHTGLVITGGPSVTVAGIDAGNLVITNVAPGEISATSTDAINGSQLHGMGDSIVNVIGGNAELNPDGTITTSDIGGTGHDNIDDAIRAANDAANAGWTVTDEEGNSANIGPNGSVAFTGDGNISVAQTGEDNSGQVEITLNRDLDVDSITAGNTVIDTDGVQVGDNVHLGDTGLVIEGGPSVTTDGIDAGGSTLTNVAAGVNDTDAVNVGQLNQVAGDVNDLGDRLDVVKGDVADLQAGATGPFQVSQEAPLVPPTPTGANSAAGGSGADASGDNSTALGNQAVASGDNSTAVGQGAQATHDNSVALGQGSATTVGAQSGYDAAYVGSSDSAGEVNVGNRTITGVAPGVAGTDAVNVNQLNAGVNHAVVTANAYTDQRFDQVQSDVWHLHGRVDELEKEINSGVATAMAMRQAPYVAGATTYYAGFGAYKDQGALGVSLRRTADNGRWSLEGGFSANRDGAGGYIGVSGVLGGK